jgi:hypothetical protein
MLKHLIATTALAGLTALAAVMPANAATRCDYRGCYRVHYRTYDRVYYSPAYDGPSYYAPAYYDPYYYRPAYYYARPYRVCDRWGCHYVREPRAHVSIGLRF